MADAVSPDPCTSLAKELADREAQLARDKADLVSVAHQGGQARRVPDAKSGTKGPSTPLDQGWHERRATELGQLIITDEHHVASAREALAACSAMQP